MRRQILEQLEQIEHDEGVRIVYACESGSRAWGFASTDSDYDVRFIYVHPLDWYLSIRDRRDVIERPISGLLDVNGWDIRKALQMLGKSNPPLMEWLGSPIVYREDCPISQQLRDLSSELFSPRTSMHHYFSMARGNYAPILKGETVKAKKYFYVLRPVLACMWIEKEQTSPPVEFAKMLQALLPHGPLRDEIDRLLARKRNGQELSLEPRNARIHDFLDEQMGLLENRLAAIPLQERLHDDLLDSFFRETIKAAWNSGIE